LITHSKTGEKITVEAEENQGLTTNRDLISILAERTIPGRKTRMAVFTLVEIASLVNVHK